MNSETQLLPNSTVDPYHYLKKMQLEIYEVFSDYKNRNNLTRLTMREKTGIKPNVLNDILNGSYNGTLKDLTIALLKIDIAPNLFFHNIIR